MFHPAIPAALAASLMPAAQPPARTGAWSPYSLLFIVLIVLLGLVMLVALIVLAMTGRFSPAKPDADSFQTQLDSDMMPPPEADETTGGDVPEAKQSAAQARPPNFVKKLFHSGLAQALLSVLLAVPAIAAFYGLENIYGQLSSFTPGAAVLLALLAAQMFCVCWLVRRLRRN